MQKISLKDIAAVLELKIRRSKKHRSTDKLEIIYSQGRVSEKKLKAYGPSYYTEVCQSKKYGVGTRLIHKPRALDKLIQRAILDTITSGFQQMFYPESYGGIPNKNMLQAIMATRYHVNNGNFWIYKLDFQNCFDNVPLQKIEKLLRLAGFLDEDVISLIMRFEKAQVKRNGVIAKHLNGLHQGAPLSPLLLNVYLMALDKYCRCHHWVFFRVLDDIWICLPSQDEARKAEQLISEYINNNLDLPINIEKSGVRLPEEIDILGYQLVAVSDVYHLVPGKRNRSEFYANLKQFIIDWQPLANMTVEEDTQEFIDKINQKVLGWAEYYQLITPGSYLKLMDGWLNRSIMLVIHYRYRDIESRYRALQCLLGSEKRAKTLASLSYQKVRMIPKEKLEGLFARTSIVSLYEEVQLVFRYGMSVKEPSFVFPEKFKETLASTINKNVDAVSDDACRRRISC